MFRNEARCDHEDTYQQPPIYYTEEYSIIGMTMSQLVWVEKLDIHMWQIVITILSYDSHRCMGSIGRWFD